MSGNWRCLGKHRVTWDLASLSPVQVGLLPKCACWVISVRRNWTWKLVNPVNAARAYGVGCVLHSTWQTFPSGRVVCAFCRSQAPTCSDRATASLWPTLFGVYHAPWSFMLESEAQQNIIPSRYFYRRGCELVEKSEREVLAAPLARDSERNSGCALPLSFTYWGFVPVAKSPRETSWPVF
jgi:hypothetical protein